MSPNSVLIDDNQETALCFRWGMSVQQVVTFYRRDPDLITGRLDKAIFYKDVLHCGVQGEISYFFTQEQLRRVVFTKSYSPRSNNRSLFASADARDIKRELVQRFGKQADLSQGVQWRTARTEVDLYIKNSLVNPRQVDEVRIIYCGAKEADGLLFK